MIGGAGRDRTDDILLAKQALSQLSYGPKHWLPQENQPNEAKLRKADGRRGQCRVSQGDGCRRRRLRPAKLVGLGGLEPPTSRLSSARSNQLSYKPLGPSATSQTS
jgi:hypothetical protein